MKTLLTVAALLCVVGLPVPIVYLTRKNKVLGSIGAIACCYIVGFAFSTIGLTGVSHDKTVTATAAYALVALSIPLILFSIDLRKIKQLTKNTIKGFAMCIASVFIVAFAMFFITLSFFPSSELAAMIVGLYTGGTPNMNAIGAAMGVESNMLSAANVSDTVVGGIYFLLLISVAPKIYRKLLNGKKQTEPPCAAVASAEAEQPHDDYSFGFSVKDAKALFKLMGAALLAVGCIGVGALFELAIEGTVGQNLLYILLSVSVLGVALSFIRPIREIKGQYTLGMYLILMFSLALSMSIDWTVFLTDIAPSLAYFACAQICVIALHALLCKFAGVDGDTAMITSTAGIYGPPFIAPTAKAAGRPDLIAPGVICGALGLAIGTLLGIGAGELMLIILKFI